MEYNSIDDMQLSRTNIGLSRSSEDLTKIQEDTCDILTDFARQSFMRQGAFRRRNMECNDKSSPYLSIRKFSVENQKRNPSNSVVAQECYANNGRRPSKYGRLSLPTVKDIWRTFKKDIKEKEETDQSKARREKFSCIDENPESIFISNLLNEFVINQNITENHSNCLDDSWNYLLSESQDYLDKSEQQTVIWELIETEASYLKSLRLIVEIFCPALRHLKSCYSEELESIELAEIFGNLDELYWSHWKLWTTSVSLPLHDSRVTQAGLDISLMKEGFLKIANILDCYRQFMSRQARLRRNLNEAKLASKIFADYIEWTKTYSILHRDGVSNFLFLPFQRITRYKLLLERILTLSNIPDQQSDIMEMIDSVHHFVDEINSLIGTGKSQEDVQEVLGDKCYLIHSKEARKFIHARQMHFDLTKLHCDYPNGRLLIHEAHMKLKTESKILDVVLFLFNDMVLICEPIRKSMLRLKVTVGPMRLDKIDVQDYDVFFVFIGYNDFGVPDYFSYIFGESDDIKLWSDKFRKTKTQYQQIRDNNDNMILARSVSGTANGDSTYFNNHNKSIDFKKISDNSDHSTSDYSTTSFDSITTSTTTTNCETIQSSSVRDTIVAIDPYPLSPMATDLKFRVTRQRSLSVEELTPIYEEFLERQHKKIFDFREELFV